MKKWNVLFVCLLLTVGFGFLTACAQEGAEVEEMDTAPDTMGEEMEEAVEATVEGDEMMDEGEEMMEEGEEMTEEGMEDMGEEMEETEEETDPN